MKAKLILAVAAATALAGAGAAHAGNLITNGGFENGSYTATDTSNGDTNGGVPVGWTPNDAFIDYNGFNHVSGNPHSGSSALSIGDYDVEPEAGLSQTFSDVVGQTYTASFYAFDGGANGDVNADLTVSAGGMSTSFNDTVSTYTLGSFTFVGTGSDTLTIAANTNPSEWYVDDVSVLGTAVSAVPEPATWALMIAGIGGIGLMLRQAKAGVGRRFRNALTA